MNAQDYIVHRANTITNRSDPFEQVAYIIGGGFHKLEVDLYITSESTFKFCHPEGSEKIQTTFTIGDHVLHDFVSLYDNVQWWVDPKCLDVPVRPIELLRHAFGAFNPQRDIVTARHSDVLQLANSMGFRTCIYRDDRQSRDFIVDFASQEISEPLTYPKDKTFVYCRDPEVAAVAKGYAGVMVDGYQLIS